jgi:hypothetical protein
VRSAFLDDSCAGDPELRQHVDRLLVAHASENHLLDMPVLEVLARDLAAVPQGNDLAGRQIHRYKIISRLDAGGIGEVWLARDTS